MTVQQAALARYAQVREALDASDASLFPGEQLQFAKDFRDAEYPKPYGRFVPLLGAYWMLYEGEYWYIVHDMVVLLQILRRYITHSSMTDFSSDVEEAYSKFWEYQPEFFKSAYPGTQNIKHDWWHLPEGWPVRMPPEAVQYAMDQGLNLPIRPTVDPALDLDAIPLDRDDGMSPISMVLLVLAGVGSIYAASRLLK